MAKPGERADIENKVGEIANRIVRGKKALENREVRWYRVNYVAKLVASVSMSAGFSPPLIALIGGEGKGETLQAAIGQLEGLPVYLSVLGFTVFGVLAIMQRIYVDKDYEKKAIQAISMFEAFQRIGIQMQQRLPVTDPMPQLNQLHEAVMTLELASAMVMPDHRKYKVETDQYSNELIQEYAKHWDVQRPNERRV